MTRDSIRRAIRTFVITTVALFVPGLLGFLNAITEWARGEGSTPFPDGRGLAYLGVSALVAGVVAVINLGWNTVEDAAGRGFLRETAGVPVHHDERGASDAVVIGVVVILALVILIATGVLR